MQLTNNNNFLISKDLIDESKKKKGKYIINLQGYLVSMWLMYL